MTLRRGGWLAGLLLGGVLLVPGRARADQKLWSWLKGCPPSSYPACHYWTPSLYRWSALFHGPFVPLHAPDHAPGLPIHYEVKSFPCPPADPASFPNRAIAR